MTSLPVSLSTFSHKQIARLLCLLLIAACLSPACAQTKPLRVGVAGLTHTHVHWIFGSADNNKEFEIVGIVEPDKELARRYTDQYKYPMSRVYPTLQAMIAAQKPDAVAAFGTIYDHLQVVEACAPAGIHVMVEKPLAVSLVHAKQMQQLAAQHNIHLLTNYETTWYPTNHKAYALVKADTVIGSLRKVVVRDGHRGPKKIGVNKEFLDWLTDPVLNGGGAITDFGCYGANLITWLLDGERPRSVTALTAQLQPENNPRVDDEAIILLQYDSLVAVIQASWNWPIGRKDMELYGLKGVVYADNRQQLRLRQAVGYDDFTEEKFTLPERPKPYNDPFLYLAAVINGQVTPEPFDLSSLENNMIVIEILDAAIESARLGKTIHLPR